MGITLGSWWINPRSGQRMLVASTSMRSTVRFNEATRRYILTGKGRPLDRYPCFLEGCGLYLAWLTSEEIRGGWRQWRPRHVEGATPLWLRKPIHNDFVYKHGDVSYWVGVQKLHRGWMCLSGIIEYKGSTPEGSFDWGTEQYNTFFVTAAEAVPHLSPKYEKKRSSSWDRVLTGGDIP